MKKNLILEKKSNPMHRLVRTIFLSLSLILLTSIFAGYAQEVNVYSYRQTDLIEPILKKFTDKTGIKTNLLFSDKGLEERIRIEGERSPADVFLSTDTTALERLKKQGSAEKLPKLAELSRLPEHMKDPKGYWVALSSRARVLYVSKERMPNEVISSYIDLGNEKYKGKICMRSGLHPYNLALFAAMIQHYGEKRTAEWMKKLKQNLARKPQGNDRAQVKAVKEGICDIALGNSYYYGLMVYNNVEPDQKKWAAAVNPVFPAGKYGTHLNISGFALVKSSPNKENAIKLLQFLLSDDAQTNYAELNYEFPAVPGVPYGKKLKALFPEKFKQDELSLVAITSSIPQAINMVNRLDFDN